MILYGLAVRHIAEYDEAFSDARRLERDVATLVSAATVVRLDSCPAGGV
ncbi:hypothetical protein [Denitromonas iodatirespirans]|uniref:Uncharacterized protein n=1 Tax=Denitromonas iodatirespirans TaxID=2795389 RepID=A0A944DC91_DENI1|nr:hypothetical protein [Denitromonas iodatirespirans]MBT0963839.1 hypothetical protein [Denitromonas iodatirespirans]